MKKYNAVTFLAFLKDILNHYPSGKIIMILDNARIHHAKLLHPFLEENKDRLELVYLPPYSPQFNLVEGLWKWLKEAVINNFFFQNIQRIILKVKEFIAEINQHQDVAINRLCVRM